MSDSEAGCRSRPAGRRRRVRAWRFVVALLLASLPWVAAAAAAGSGAPHAPALRDYAIDAWTTRNGLPHNSLRDIAQTPDGYLWFATWEGVVRYNGVAFTVFDRGSEQALRDNGVGALYVDPRGRLWISDSRGNVGRLEADGRWAYVERMPQWPQALVHDTAYQALNAIRIILARDDLEDPECFRRIEKIVRVFERIGSDCGTRHDFG